MKNSKIAFTVDFERVRTNTGILIKEQPPIEQITEELLEFLSQRNIKATFFIVGEDAREYPQAVSAIIGEGHEIACHGWSHKPLHLMSPNEFRQELLRSIDCLTNLGAQNIKGFRSPYFSLTKETSWAWELLIENKFLYSSSVMPVSNPIYGWSQFGRAPYQKITDHFLEFPMPIMIKPPFNIPFSGGTYLRLLPIKLLLANVRYALSHNDFLIVYVHPYDFYPMKTVNMHPNKLFNWMLHLNRSTTYAKLNKILTTDTVLLKDLANWLLQ